MKKLLIIGGGVSGLSAAIHARLLGFEAVVVEKNPRAGGLCTYWQRNGCHIDGSLHWLTGTQKGTSANDMWRTLGVLSDDTPVENIASQGTLELKGKTFSLYSSLDMLEKELLKVAPEDKAVIRQLIRDVKAVSGMNMPAKAPVEFLPLREKLSYGLPAMKMFFQVKNRIYMTNGQFAEKFKSPVLRAYFGGWPQCDDQHMGWLFKAAMLSRGNADYPIGGSRHLTENMIKKFKALGGEIITSKEADELVMENGSCASLKFTDGTEMTADYYLCPCDPHISFTRLLRGKYKLPQFEERYNSGNYFVNSSIDAFFDVAVPALNLPYTFTFEIEPLTVVKHTLTALTLRYFGFEQSFAPEGHSVVSVNIIQQDECFDYWINLREKDYSAYLSEKKRITDEVIKRIEARFPGLDGKISLADIYTPATYHRYTGAYHGGWMGFRSNSKGRSMTHSGEIPGVENVYLTGQWLQPPGGLPVAAAMSKFTVQRICKKEGMPFLVKE